MEELCHLIQQRKFSEAVRICDQSIKSTPTPVHFCNRAYLSYKLELYRKCVKDCDAALEIDKNYTKAYLRKALHSMGKKEEAVKIWTTGLQTVGDLEVALEIQQCLQGNFSATSPSSSTTSPPPSSVPKTTSQTSKNVSSETASKGAVQFGVDRSIDQRVAVGYMHVNTGAYPKAIELFTSLLLENPKIVGAFLGRGTAYALQGELDKAIADFSGAIHVDPLCADAYKRRGQSRASQGFETDALEDFSRVIELTPNDADCFHQRGLVYYRSDFQTAAAIDPSNKLTWDHLGLSYVAVGMAHEAIGAHGKAVGIDPKFQDAWIHIGQAYKELGIPEKAFQSYSTAEQLGPSPSLWSSRALLRFGLGDHRGTIQDLSSALQTNPSLREPYLLRGVARHGLGLFDEAESDYSIVIANKPDSPAWYQREILRWVWGHLDESLSTINLDASLDPALKEGWCKRHHPATLSRYSEQKRVKGIPPVSLSFVPSPSLIRLMDFAKRMGPRLHLSSAGYLSNRRQQAMGGFAVIELAQKLKGSYECPMSFPGVWFNNDTEMSGLSSSGNRSSHSFGWRDMYDLLIKWRQLSEPNDPVWWVDLLTPQQFHEGFGSHTPMITGHTKVIRYYPMFARAFRIMKNLLPVQHNLSDAMAARVEAASDCRELYDLIRRDFWVVTPCESTGSPGKVLEGTRLTLQYVPPEGYEYSIRTPGTPPRWEDYDAELSFVWEALSQAVKESPRNLDKISDLILTMTFYWYNFMPLSRGTAAVGYLGLLGMFLANDIEIATPVPKDVQVDWEGILRPRASDFIATISPWMYPARQSVNIDALPSIGETLPTIRSLIEAINELTLDKYFQESPK